MRGTWKPAAAAVFLICSEAAASNVVEILQNPVPQFSSKTCQSYSAAVLLAFKNDANFAVNTAQALRNAETSIRNRIEHWATVRDHKTSTGKLDPRHDDIESAFSDYTSGAYKLTRKTLSGIVALGDFISTTTGITSEQAAPFPIVPSLVKAPVMVSVTRVGNDSYPSGHLVTVLGVSGPANSTRKYLILNSAVKTGNSAAALFCDPGAPATQTTYSALTSWTNNLDFKDFGAGTYYAFTAVKN
jgi:hypothetical protein